MLGDNKQYLVSSRVGRIMLEHDIKNLNELVGRLRREPLSPLRQIIIDAMTTNETLWFRDVHPYTILKDKLLPELQKTPGMHKVRIWSAACSSGQEPYSISMTVEEYKRAAMGVLKAPVEIVATDLSRSILQSAQDGIYDGLSVARGLSAERLRLYFDKQGDRWQIKPFVKQRVRFQSLNLLDHYGVLGKFDIVFCRNVLIYFSAQLKTDILRRIHATLKPGGYLLVGASEGLNNLSDIYEMVQCSPGIIYRAK
jgi:chemotaxis protein methyltransferase CheR